MSQKIPKISIITPSFNQASYIERTIQSVLGQNYPNLEYVIMDGASTDGTLAILEKYKNQIKLISQKDKGQSDAINKGLKIVSGDIVGYLNSDDLLEKNSLEIVGNYFLRNPKYQWMTGKCHIIDSKGDKIRKSVTSYKNIFLKYLRFLNSLYILNFISQPATFWRRGVIDDIGLFNNSYHFSMDYDYWLRIYNKYDLGFINHYLASFRVHESSKGSNNLLGQLKESFQISQKYNSSGLIQSFHRLHDIISSYLYRNYY